MMQISKFAPLTIRTLLNDSSAPDAAELLARQPGHYSSSIWSHGFYRSIYANSFIFEYDLNPVCEVYPGADNLKPIDRSPINKTNPRDSTKIAVKTSENCAGGWIRIHSLVALPLSEH